MAVEMAEFLSAQLAQWANGAREKSLNPDEDAYRPNTLAATVAAASASMTWVEWV